MAFPAIYGSKNIVVIVLDLQSMDL